MDNGVTKEDLQQFGAFLVGTIRKMIEGVSNTDKEAVRKIKEEAAAKGFPFVQVSARKNIAYSYN